MSLALKTSAAFTFWIKPSVLLHWSINFKTSSALKASVTLAQTMFAYSTGHLTSLVCSSSKVPARRCCSSSASDLACAAAASFWVFLSAAVLAFLFFSAGVWSASLIFFLIAFTDKPAKSCSLKSIAETLDQFSAIQTASPRSLSDKEKFGWLLMKLLKLMTFWNSLTSATKH